MAVDQSQPLKNKIKQNKTEQNKTVSKLICYLICFSFSCSWRLPMIRIDGITNFNVHGPIRAHKKVAGRLLHCDGSWRRRSSHHIFPLLSLSFSTFFKGTPKSILNSTSQNSETKKMKTFYEIWSKKHPNDCSEGCKITKP